MADENEGLSLADKTRQAEKSAAATQASERNAAMTEAAKRVRAANENPALWDSKHTDHEKARKELREALAADASPEEKQEIADAPIGQLT